MAVRLVKVHFTLDSMDWHGHGGEFVWAAPVSAIGQTTFRIDNTPFFARDIGYRDIVEAKATEDKIVFEFERVVERSGYSTYMILVKSDEPRFNNLWSKLGHGPIRGILKSEAV